MVKDSFKPFGKWRARFFPIYRHELAKVLPMSFIFFLISLNYNALRIYKDTFIVTANHSGAEAIPFIKTWVVVPSAILCTFFYTRLSQRFSPEKVFYIILSIFFAFFFLFTFVFYPAQEFFHPNHMADALQKILPIGYKGLIATFRNWTFTLFYVFSELWSTMVFTILFWGFVNEVTALQDARRYYGFIMTVGNIAGIFSGQLTIAFSQNHFISWIPYGKTPWDQSIFFLTCLILISGALILELFRRLNISCHHERTILAKEVPKVKLSIRQSIRYLIQSPYLTSVALIVLSYNISFNLVEVVWKDQIKQAFPDPALYNILMGKVITATAIVGTIAGFFFTSNALCRYSWTASAMIPPIIMGGSGIIFFIVICAPHFNITWPQNFYPHPALIGVFLGAVQNCITRACKYTIFDSTKEIALVPLDRETKLLGKAAIDGFGSRLGKSTGSFLHQGFFIIFSSISASTPYVAIVFLIVIVIWSFSVLSLGKHFEQLSRKISI